MRADEYNMTWFFVNSLDTEETVELGVDAYDEHVVVLSDDVFSIQDVPKLITALKLAYNFHYEHKENT